LASGIWQIDVNNLVNGIYNLSAIASDIAGNVSTPSTPFTITIDSVAPTLTLTTPIDTTPLNQEARFVGSANGTGSGIAEITYRFNSSTDIPVVVNPDGSFNQQLDLTGLPNGNHILTVTTTDVAGNIFTKEYNVTVNIDTEAPIITVSLVRDTAPGNATNSDRITSNPAITGTVTDANRVVELKAGLNNTAINSFVDITAQIQPNGSFILDNSALATIYNATNSGNNSNNSIPDGTYTLRLVAKDEFGNTSPTKEYTFTLDTTTPAPTNLDLPASIDSGLSPTDNITNFNTPTITGNAEANSTVQLFNNGNVVGEATTNADGIWQIVTSDLTDGTYNLNAQATDIAGNVSSISTPIQLIIDRTLPQLNLTTPIDNAPLTTGAKLIGNVDGTGSGISSLSYRFDNSSEVSVTLDNTGNFNQQLDLTALTSGSHVLTLVATDIAGNVKTISYNVTINNDTIAPVITAGLKNDTAPSGTINSNPNDGKLSDRITYDPSITGFVTDTSSIASFKAGFNNQTAANFVDVFAQLNTDGSFNFNRTQLEAIYGGTIPDGAHTLRLIASDSYGNTSNAFSFTFTLDTNIAQPTFNLDATSDSGTVGDKKTKFNTVTLTGLTEPGAILILEQTGANGATSPVLGQNGTPLTVTADNTGKYNFTNVELTGGNNIFTVRATDIAGNTSSFSTTIYRFSAPTAINLTHNTVAENSAVGTVIGELSSIDSDSGDTHTYTLVDNAGGRFQIVDNKLQVVNSTLLDFEANTQHTVIIRSTDKNGLILDKTQAIAITNVNEVPIFTSTPNNTTVESGSTFTYNITTTDPDAGDIRTLNAVGLPTWLTFTDNGNGTATITGTPNQNQLGLFNIAITATDGGGLKATQNIIIGSQITLSEQTNFSPKRNFGLTIPVTPSILTFKIDPSFDLSDTKFINDAFEVALVDANGISLVHAIGKGRDAFFNLTEGEPVGNGAGATYNPTTKTVSLNLVGVKPSSAELIFRLVNDDKDTATSVRITDFALVAAPAGTIAATQTQFATEIRPNAAPNFNTLVDVSNSLAAQYQRSSFNADTKTLYADIAVRNIGSYSVDVPVLVAVKNISDPSVILRNPDGVTPDGIPYYDFTSLVASGKLNPNGETSSRSLAFYNPNGVQFTYDVVVLAQLNQKPVIDSKPVVEVIGGQQYRYDVNATDPNGDSVTYKLLTSPEGMTIEENTGLITWNTLTSNKGNQSVFVEVSDGRGGVTLQNYILSVIDTPPNRPPIFTTTPIVDAYINKLYKYDADAVDPDGDYPLSYSLIVGPNGMTVNKSTGVVEWTPPPVLVLGDTVLGRVGIPGENDEFTFSGTKGQRIYFDPLQYSGDYYNWRFDVYSPSNIKVINGADFRWDNNQLLTLTEDGNYRIVVDAQGDYVGNYGFSVIDSNLVPVVPFDTKVQGSLSPGSEDDVFRFTGNKGQKLYFDELNKEGNLDWVVYNASNQVVASNDNFDDMEVDLLADGQYILALRGKSAFSSTVDYSFTIVTPDIITKPLTLGSNDNAHIINDAISEKGEQDVYTFTGSIGQRLSFDTITNGYYTTTAHLESPSGITIFYRDLSSSNVGPFTLIENGTYRLRIDGNGETTDAYSFSMLDVGQATPIALDTDVSNQLNPGQQTQFYKFGGTAGQRLYLDSLMDVPNTYWDLVDSGDRIVTSSSISNDLEVTLNSTGTYTLAIYGFNDSPVDYQFRVITPDTQSGTLTLGSTVSGEITEKGEQDIYTFTGNVNTRLFLDALLETPNISARLLSASGIEVFNTSIAYDYFRKEAIILPETGTYQLIVDGYGETTGSYSFRLANLSAGANLAQNTPTSGTLNPGSSINSYKFTGNAGDRLYLDSQIASPNSSWLLYTNGNELVGSASLGDDFEVVLPANGTYYLMLRGDGTTDPINYKIQLVPSTAPVTNLTLGSLVNTNILQLGEQDVYTFTGSVGQRLYFDPTTGSSNITAKLVSPSGLSVINSNTTTDSTPIVLVEAGTYRLTIDGEGDTTGNYSFRLTDLATASSLTLGTATNGSIAANSVKLFNFIGTAGQRLKFDSLTATPNADWVLYASGTLPSGNSVVGSASLSDDFEVLLPTNGIYTLALRSSASSSSINYNIQVNTIASSSGTNSGLGTIRSGNVTTGQQVNQTFTASAGTYVYFDSQIPYEYYHGVAARLLDPTGDELFYINASSDSNLIQLAKSGTYTLRMSGDGSYRYQMIDLGAASDLSLNTITNVSLNPGESAKAYKFAVTLGTQLFYDALNSNDPNVSVRLFSPGGRELFNMGAQYDRGLDGGLTLNEAGTYYLLFSGNQEAVTNVSFRLLNKASATAINLDTNVTSTFDNNGIETDVYRFNGNAGQYIYIDQEAGGYPNAWILYGPGGQYITYNYLSGDGELALPGTGQYLLAMQGNGASDVNYKFRIVTPEFVTTPLVLGETKNGIISEKGEQDTYTFNGTAGQQLFYDALNTNNPGLTIKLYSPSGREVYNAPIEYDRGLDGGLTLTETGTYRLVIDGNESASGNYSFRLLDKAAATAINLNTDITGTFAPSSIETDLYRFSGAAGQYIYLDQQAGEYPNAWILYGPGGQQITYNYVYGDGELALPGTGEYLLAMQGNGAGDVNYKFRIVTPEFVTTPLTLNQTVSGTISKQGENDTYTFNGTVGQQLFFDALNTNDPNFTVRLFAPSGKELYNGGVQNDRGPETQYSLYSGFTLTEVGTYRLVIDGNAEATGNYSFQLLDKASATAINLDTDVTGTFDNGGVETDLYRFSGAAGQYIYIDQQADGYNSWILYGSAGQYITSNYVYSDGELALPGTGEYLLAMQGNGANDVNYKFHIATPEFVTTPLTLNQTVNGIISKQGENDTYTFTATAGQQLFYDALNTNNPNFTVRLFSPSGREVFNAPVENDRGVDGGLTLSETGTYRLVVDGNGEATGNYSFRLLDKASATALTFDTDVTGSFGSDSRETDVYRFNSTLGQYIYIDLIDGSYNDGWTLYGPGGQVVTSLSAYYDSELALPATGEYLLAMQGNGNVANYTFHVAAPEFVTTPLTLNQTVSSTISKRGEQDTYTFSGTVGQQLFFDALNGNNSLKARLIAPSGLTVVNKDTSSDWGAFNLGETGTYRLVIDGDDQSTGNYSFILSDRSTAPTIQIGTPISGNLNPGNKVNLYQFTANSGQSLKFDLDTDTWSGANWILYDPNGTIFKAPDANIPDFNVTFGASGLYTLAIAGNSDTRVDYSFKVTNTSVTPVTNTGLGAVQSGRLNAGQVIDYNFTATAGTLILLDSQDSSNSEIRNRLINPDGTLVFTDSDSRYDTAPILLEQTGNYKLQTFGYYDSTAGDYKLNLLELPRSFRSPNLNYLEIGSVVSGNLNALQDKAYTFDGVHGQKFMFNAMIGENVRASLYDPNGNNIFSTSNFQWNGDSGLFTLTTDGLYYLVIANDEAASRNYSFQLLDTTVAPDITYSLPKAGSLDNGQQSQFFKLQAKVGDRLYFDSLTDSIPDGNYRWKLFDPGNNQLFDTEQRYDSEIVIGETGEYYLYIQGGSGTDKVDYNFRVLRHEKVVSDVITPGTGEKASNSGEGQGLFNVKLSAKDALGASTVQDFNIKLLPDPDNGNPVIITTPKTRFALADKVYQYKLKSVDPDGDKLTYRLLDAPLGALIDNDTGELLWFPESTVTTGSQVNFQVEVNDRRGGKDIQSFAVDVYNNLGKIQGAVFDDLNSNGLLDSKLVKGDNPAIVFAIDVSGSTAAPFFGEEGNKTTKTVLDAQVAAANAMIDAVVASGGGDRIKFGIIPHKFNAVIQDMDLATEGLQIYTTANADTNGNDIADIREILSSYRPDGSNNFTTALQTIDSLFDALPGTPNLIFMSDGYGPLDPTIANQVVTDIKAKGGNVTAFGVGLYSTIETIQKIDSNAERITDFEKLIDVFSGFDDRYALEPFKENVTVYLDLNNNGILDQGEPNQLTKKDTSTSTLGKNRYYYTFDDLLPGTYTIRTVVPNGYTLTTPTSGAKVDTITLDGEDFIHLAGLGKVSEPVNVDPIFVTTPDKFKVRDGENLIYRAIATDANADPLNYDLILAPPGMTLDKTTGTVVWSPSKQIIEQYYAELRAERERLTALGRGEFARNTVELNVGLRVRDGKGGQALQYINIELLPDNIAPVFTSVPKNNKAQVDKTFRYQATALNTDGDVLVYSEGDGAPDGLSVTNTGLVTWTPNSAQLGNQEFTIKVTDGKGGEALQRVSVVVGANLPNTAPDITSTPRTVVRQGNTYFYKVEANDVDGDVLTYSLVTKPTGMDITQDGVISWTPTAAQFGNYTLSVDVSDGTLTTTQDFTLNVTNFAPNYAPTITSTPNLITNLERTYEYNLIGTDPDNDLLLWSIDSAPEGMVIDATTGALRWQPSATQIGEHTVAVKLTDAYGAYTGQEFTLTVRGINTPPAIVSNPVTIAAQNQVYTYNVVATDIENDEVTYSLGRRPVGMTISDEGKVEWKPTSSQIGSQTVEVIARDSQGATSTQTFTIEVGTTAINNAPSITSTPKFVASVGSPYQYQVVATDPDSGDTLTYQILSKPSGVDVQINPTTGLLTWDNPTSGQYQIVVGAVDTAGLGAAQGFILTARNNSNPVINSTAPSNVTPGSIYAYDVKATDADGDNLTYNLDSASLGKGITVDALGRLRWNPTTTNVGNNTINVTVNDGNGGSATQTINLTVAQDTVAPSLRLIALNDTANLGSDITFQARATDNVKVASLQLTVDGTPVVLDRTVLSQLRHHVVGQLVLWQLLPILAGTPNKKPLMCWLLTQLM
jgi:hypothetical protein